MKSRCLLWPMWILLFMVFNSSMYAQQQEDDLKMELFCKYLDIANIIEQRGVYPHWMNDGNSFWYADRNPTNPCIYKVDPVSKIRALLFEAAKLNEISTDLIRDQYVGQGFVPQDLTFIEDENSVRFSLEDKQYILDLNTYTIIQDNTESKDDTYRLIPQITREREGPISERWEKLSPDQQWFATLKKHNLWLRSTHNSTEVQLTYDGIKDY
jgi:dipeptidyl-peptidase-4